MHHLPVYRPLTPLVSPAFSTPARGFACLLASFGPMAMLEPRHTVSFLPHPPARKRFPLIRPGKLPAGLGLLRFDFYDDFYLGHSVKAPGHQVKGMHHVAGPYRPPLDTYRFGQFRQAFQRCWSPPSSDSIHYQFIYSLPELLRDIHQTRAPYVTMGRSNDLPRPEPRAKSPEKAMSTRYNPL